MAAEVIGHDPEDTAAEGALLREAVYYADGTRAGVTTPDDGYWTTRYIGSLIYEGEPGQETLEGIVTDVSCIFMQVDPMAEKYYGMTPYGYCAGSPVMMVDKSGKEYSTHTDKNGKVLAVYKDGDLGVYRHDNAMCKADFSQNYSSEDTSAGGELVGYSLQEESFSSFEGVDNLRIKFNSAELTDKVTEIVRSNPSIIQYALKARAHGDWDLKTKVKNGSLLFGKYASPRDAGNFAAGMISQSKGDNISFIIDFGYGAYNICKNKMIPTAILCLKVLQSEYPQQAMWYIAKYGEDAVSKKAQSLGKEYYKTHVYGKDK